MSNTILLGKTLKGADVKLDLQQLVTGRTFVCAISGGGKSHFSIRVIEQAFGQVGLIVIDVEGEYANLRENYPFLIIGKDVPLTPEAAEFLADQVLENELSVIIDGSDANLDEATFQEFVQRFLDRFLALETTKRKPYLIVAEEADELAPEHNFAKSLCGPAIKKLAKKGRKRGAGIMTITQRPQSVEKGVVSQSRNKAIGQLDWDPDKEVVYKFARIPKDIVDRLDTFARGDFYLSGDFVEKPCIVHVGPIKTRHLGETPEVIPPAPRELAGIVAALTEKLPAIVQEKLVPAVPQVAKIEARLKEKLEAQWQARLARLEKEKATIKNKTEAKSAVEIADLKRKLEEAARSAALQGGAVSDLLQHPLVVAAFKKGGLDERQKSLMELLEKGPRTNDQLRLFLQTGKDGVDMVRRAINKKIPGLIDLEKGQYVSRLAKLFPVTEEAKAEAKEVEGLREENRILAENNKARAQQILDLSHTNESLQGQIVELRQLCAKVAKERDILRTTNQRLVEISQGKEIPAEKPPSDSYKSDEKSIGMVGNGSPIPVEATLRRTLTKFNVATNTEVLDADESTPIGRILASGLRGFFREEQGISAIAGEILRKYSIAANSGGNKTVYQKALEELVAKDILDRRDNNGAWLYRATEHFNERVRPLQGAATQ